MPDRHRFPTVLANWEHFATVDIAPEAPPVQRHEMQRAFMAGVSSGLLLTVNAYTDGDFKDGVAKINAELATYLAVFNAGKPHEF